MTAKLQALERHEPLGDRVYATLRGYLRAGRIPHGQPLQEAALAAQLGALRFRLEPEALRLVAASKPDRKALAPLRAGLEGMAAAHEAGDGAAFMEANYRYRDAWTDLVPNKRLVRAIHLYADHVRYLRAFTLDEPAVRAVVLKGLKRLSLALAAGDGDAAAEAMRAHLDKAKQILIDKIRRS